MNLPDYIRKYRAILKYSNDPEELAYKLWEEDTEYHRDLNASIIRGSSNRNLPNEIADLVIVLYALKDITNDNNYRILLNAKLDEVTKVAEKFGLDVYKCVVYKFKQDLEKN